MIRRDLVIGTILSLSLVAIFGATGTRAMLSYTPEDAFVATGDSDSAEERDEFHQTYPLSANGRVSVENLNGAVQIKVWDRDAVQVDAVRRAYRKERLQEAKIDVYTTPESIRIKTVYPDWDQTFTDDEKGRYNNPAIVDYSLTVPRKVRLESVELVNGALDVDGVEGAVKASSINGKVVARGLMGESRLSTVNGNLEATFTQLNDSTPLSLSSVNGNVVLVIPSDSNAIVRAGTVHGSITNDFGIEVQHGEYVGHELYGQVGNGGPRIRLGNVNGGISIRHAQDGRTVSPGTSLLTEKEKFKEKNKVKISEEDQREIEQEKEEAKREAEEANREATQQAREDAREARERALEDAREARRLQVEVQREAEQAIREAQREIQKAQAEIQRETERQAREAIRMENRGYGRGEGSGKGRGEGWSGTRVLDRESKSFSVSGQPQVNVGTFDGTVTVRGWDKAEVMYTATKRGNDEAELKEITIDAQQQGSSISIIAKSPESNGSVSLEVFVPRSSGLHVSSDDGRLDVQGVSGQITLRTGDGAIEVSDSGGRLNVNTGDGHIRIAKFDGQVEARTGDGAIILEGKFASLAARTGDGSITLAVPGDSNFTVETNAEEISNEGLNVSEEIAPSPRLKRWRVGRGGNVFTLSTGDGKVVLRTQ
jgi:DUF4097 and DUF4098 domain-containing protein YvlB